MFSSSPKAGRFGRAATRRPFYHRTRYLYLAITVLILYLWHSTSFLHQAPIHAPSLNYKNVDWSLYAYSSYASDTAHLCNSVMLFEALSRLGSKADRILFYPETWDLQVSDSHDRDSQLLVKAKEEFDTKLIPIEADKSENGDWNANFTQFLVWDQTQYDRVLHLDTDMTLYNHLDELFMLPKTSIAMTRAYWKLPEKALSSKLLLIEPSHREYKRLLEAGRAAQKSGKTYDMDSLDGYYDGSALVLPHLGYGLTSGEFRSEDLEKFLGQAGGVWDPERGMKAASVVYFLDEPFPKPWIMGPRNLFSEKVPQCKRLEADREDCRDKKIWLGLYDDFRQRRKVYRKFKAKHNLLISCRIYVGSSPYQHPRGQPRRKQILPKPIAKLR